MKTKTFLPALILTALTFAFSVDGNVIFSDDFTDAAATTAAWSRSIPHNFTTTVANGALTLVNDNIFDAADFSRTLGDVQTSEFTITYVQKSASVEPRHAGLLFCRESTINGYLLTLEGNLITVFRMIGGDASSIFRRQSLDASRGDNEITVSKRGNLFNIFLNDVYQGSFTDSQFGSGGVSFFLRPGGSATFGAITMTDTFKEGEFPRTFSDNFDDGSNSLWINQTFGITAEAGVLRMNAQGYDAQTRIDFPMTLFDAEVDVRYISHVGDYSNSNFFGIILTMNVPTSNNQYLIHNVYFLIDNWGYFAVGDTRVGGNYNESDDPHDAIHWGTTDLPNTLRVVRLEGAGTYEFYVNGTKLPVDFPVVTDITISGIGLFVGNGTTAEFDNFTVTRSGEIPSSIRRAPQPSRQVRRTNVSRSQFNDSFYDMRGRRVYRASPSSRNNASRRNVSAGMYVNEERKEVKIRRR